MALIVFEREDTPYLQWIDDNPNGYVVNTGRGRNSSYFTLHRSSCRTISRYIKGQYEGGYTARDYIKVCSNDAQEILYWASMNRPKVSGFNSLCKKCKPDPHINQVVYPDQVPTDETYIEGATRIVTVNYYERSSSARKKCIENWGLSCRVCGMQFEERYGEIGRGFIHVHHLRELHSINREYEVDPIQDLRPVCPNCHAMLHKRTPPYTIEELKEKLNE